jgi:hypothetical protein
MTLAFRSREGRPKKLERFYKKIAPEKIKTRSAFDAPSHAAMIR